MVVIRMLAWLLLLAGIGLFGHAAIELLKTGSFEPVVFALFWVWIDRSSQLGVNHFLEQTFGAEFHQAFLIPYFWGAAAYAVFLVPGILLWMVSRPRD